MPPSRILVIDDEADTVSLLRFNLGGRGFDVAGATDGATGLAMALDRPPDLVVLDLMMPEPDGYQVCHALRAGVRTRHLPVLMLTARTAVEDRIEGLACGADDYLTKPFELRELFARVDALLRRSQARLDANPLTHLPGNNAIHAHIGRLLGEGTPFTALYVDLDGFKAFNDRHGFARGDGLIRLVGRVLADETGKTPPPAAFAGHIGGDDFLVLCDPGHAASLARAVIGRFEAEVELHHPAGDPTPGGLVAARPVPVSITVAGVADAHLRFASPRRLAEALARVKAEIRRRGAGSKWHVE